MTRNRSATNAIGAHVKKLNYSLALSSHGIPLSVLIFLEAVSKIIKVRSKPGRRGSDPSGSDPDVWLQNIRASRNAPTSVTSKLTRFLRPLLVFTVALQSAGTHAADGEGPYQRLVVRGVTLIDGSGAPPIGPVDIVIRKNRIEAVEWRRFASRDTEPAKAPGTDDVREIDAHGMYALPGFVDLHGHVRPGVPPEYIYKLWLAHGVTTIRDPACHRGINFCIAQKALSAKNAIAIPRFYAYVHTNLDILGLVNRPGYDWSKGRMLRTPEMARDYVRYAKGRGVDGFKTYGLPPDVFAALIDEAHKHELGVATHLMQLWNIQTNAVEAAAMGVDTIEHWYGVPESLLVGHDLQPYDKHYNFFDEVARFADWVAVWDDAAEPGSKKWDGVLSSLLNTGVTLDPTLSITESMRDTVRSENKPWFDVYGHPNVLKNFRPNPEQHGGFLHEWTSAHEASTYRALDKWFRFLNDYKNRGGRVTLGTDSGVFYSLYGFAYIREMELLQHAGFNALEVIRAATFDGAQAIAAPLDTKPEFGLVREGYLADLVIVDGNPMENFKILGGMGVLRVDPEARTVSRDTAIEYVVKDGLVYTPRELLEDVREIVANARQQ